ncbi:hypothetical protein LSH36_180g03031 [Paralvinella palmiformis]|uniref:C2H2-type domain-containing protein n=1 Tax=Paralvinella palmiformis TaxID=53620 RepID=A0AAD9JRT1_9ANNE|nr:hypothetical protein LSH36_180g03031 [Paralvinella palmiformis]
MFNMVIQKADQARLKGLVTEAISNLCRSGLNYKSEFCIEGLLGITLDNDDIFLINIKETITNDKLGLNSSADRDLCDLTMPSSMPCSISDASLLMSANAMSATLDFSKTGLLYDKTDRQDAFQLNALDLNIASGCGNTDFEMLFDLTTTTGRKQDLLPMDMSTSFLGQENDTEQPVSKEDGSAKEEENEISESSDLVLIKEESRFQMEPISLAQTSLSMKPELQFMSLDVTSAAHTAETMLMSFKADDQFTPADLEGTQLDPLPLNLSDPQDPEPQDLSTNQINKQKSKPACDVCGKKFRSEGGLQKHKDKEHPGADGNQPEAEALVKDSVVQPLDLTIGRGENESDLEQELNINEQEPFTCVCSKVISDYESYVDHVTNCSKSRLTPCKSCEICGKYFFSNSGYVKHKRLHVGAYKFHCSVCHKGFFDRTHLSAHMDSSHNKVRRYECNFCKKSFFWKHHLKRHKSTCDKARQFLSLSEEEQQQNSESHSGIKSDAKRTKLSPHMELEDVGDTLPLELLHTHSNVISLAAGCSP